MVILRFDNLTGDPALDWMCRGAARAIGAQIEGATFADSTEPAEERQRAIAGGATRILHGYLSGAGGTLRLQADLEDTRSGKFPWAAEASGPETAGLPPLADAVAHQLDAQARPPATKSGAALEAYVAAFDAPNAAAASELLTRAMTADPDFATPYLALIELDRAHQDRAGAERILAMARARGAVFSAADRARLEVTAAQLSGDGAALSKALAALARQTPDDPKLLANLAESQLQTRHYAAAIGYFEKALAAQPGDAALLNSLGYAQAYAGDLNGAVKTMREYERTHPADANPLDSLGDVHFYWGRFAEAEQFYRAEYNKDPAFLNGGALIKAAMAHLFTGDASGAETVFAEYENARRAANDPLIGFRRAEWDHLRGKAGEAVRDMEKFAASTRIRDLASLAYSQLSIWLVETGDRPQGARYAAKAAADAASPSTRAFAASCSFIAAPTGSSYPNTVARVYALLLSSDFAGALPLLRALESQTPPNPSDPAPVLLAWALEQTGRVAEAEPYLRTTPVPSVSGPAPFESIVYPRIFHLRAVAAEKKGDRAAAERNARLFQTLSGPK